MKARIFNLLSLLVVLSLMLAIVPGQIARGVNHPQGTRPKESNPTTTALTTKPLSALSNAEVANPFLSALASAKGSAEIEVSPVASSAALATVSIDPAQSTVVVGDLFTVDVVVSDAEDLGAYEFSMAFDPVVVEVVDVADGGFLGATGRSVTTTTTIDNVTGMIHVEAASSNGGTPGPDGDGVLATITLEASIAGETDLDLYDLLLSNTAGSAEDPSETDGLVTVEACDPPTITNLTSDSPTTLGETTLFTATVTGTEPFSYTWDFGGAGVATGDDTATPTFTYEESGTYTTSLTVENATGTDQATLGVCLLFGDVNGDGSVNATDIQEVANRWRTSCANSDPDGDPETPNYDSRYDLDDDCDIDVIDIMQVAAQWGDACE